CKDGIRRDALADQIGDTARNDASLAAAGGGDDEQWAIRVRNCFALGVGQVVQKMLRINHGRMIAASPQRRECGVRVWGPKAWGISRRRPLFPTPHVIQVASMPEAQSETRTALSLNSGSGRRPGGRA